MSEEFNARSEDRLGPGLLGSMAAFPKSTLLIILLVTALSAGMGLYIAPDAQVSATVALKTPRSNNVLAPGIQGDATLNRYTTQRARFMTSDAVLTRVVEARGGGTTGGVRSAVRATPSASSNLIILTVEYPTPEGAVQLANQVIAAFRAETLAQIRALTDEAIAPLAETEAQVLALLASPGESDASRSSAASTLGQLQLQRAEIESSSSLLGDGVEFVVAPRESAVIVPGLPIREAALGFIVGLVLAGTVAWVRADRKAQRGLDRSHVLANDPSASGYVPKPKIMVYESDQDASQRGDTQVSSPPVHPSSSERQSDSGDSREAANAGSDSQRRRLEKRAPQRPSNKEEQHGDSRPRWHRGVS